VDIASSRRERNAWERVWPSWEGEEEEEEVISEGRWGGKRMMWLA